MLGNTYFGAANVTIDSTVFCTLADDEENTTKFNSLGWSGSFDCPVDIETIAFPTNNTAFAEPELSLDHKNKKYKSY
jgi:hypothetical protein